jgi:outer membrane protein assembly factor BamB
MRAATRTTLTIVAILSALTSRGVAQGAAVTLVRRPCTGRPLDSPVGTVPKDPTTTTTPTPSSGQWRTWRGPNANGIAEDTSLLEEWSDSKNVLWKSPIPGRGHSSPCVSGDRIYLTTADEKTKEQFALAYSRTTGRQLWKKRLHEGGFNKPGMVRRTWANSSAASDGEHIYFLFSNHGAIWATAMTPDGDKFWRTRVGDFVSHHGYSASPTIYADLLVIAGDHKKGGYLTALDRKTGKSRWTTPRPPAPSYVSPIVLKISGRDQLVISGCDILAGYDPRNGEQLWSVKTTTTECVGTVVGDGDLVFASGGYPEHLTVGVTTKEGGKVLWKNKIRTYIPSMLLTGGHLYTVTDRGIAYCWDAMTGAERWKGRLKGNFAASAVLVGDRILVTSEQGVSYTFRAKPDAFELLTTNKLGDETFASPIVCGNTIYLRVAHRDEGTRQEMLYAIGQR